MSITIMACGYCKKPFTWEPAPNPEYRPGNGGMICEPCSRQADIDAEREKMLEDWYYAQHEQA